MKRHCPEGKQGGALSLSLDEVGSQWPLIRYLLDVPEYKAQYQEYLFNFVETVFTPDRMTAIYSDYEELIKEYALAESAPYSFLRTGTEFESAVAQLKEHVLLREAAVQSYLSQ